MTKQSSHPTYNTKLFSGNKKAFYDYEVLDTIEAGIILSGGEVKSVKTGQASIKEAFIAVGNGEAWLWAAHIPQWQFSSEKGYDPLRKRKLLLHRKEIDLLTGKAKEKGLTLIPLKLYGLRGRVKVAVGSCRGKKQYEKRQKEKERWLKHELHEEKRRFVV